MKIVSSLATFLVLIALSFAALAQEPLSSTEKSLDAIIEFAAQNERGAQVGENLLAPIRSRGELAAYLQSRKESPFNVLSQRSLQLFVDSLVFTEHGLASYRYRELESEMSPRQAFELLSLFGAQKTLSNLHFANASAEERQAQAKLAPVLLDDHKGYRCVPPATCQSSMDHICIGANCGMYPW